MTSSKISFAVAFAFTTFVGAVAHLSAADPHAEQGPHKGQLIELGKEEYHAELVADDAAHKVTIYLLDGAAKKSVATTEKQVTINLLSKGKPAQFVLPAKAESGDPAGQSSRFELVSQPLCDGLDEKDNKARLSVTVNGKPYTGSIGGHAH